MPLSPAFFLIPSFLFRRASLRDAMLSFRFLIAVACACASVFFRSTLDTDQHALCEALRSGELDGTDPKVRDAVVADVRARLLVANPKYFAVPHP